jgi:hypothetical protein
LPVKSALSTAIRWKFTVFASGASTRLNPISFVGMKTMSPIAAGRPRTILLPSLPVVPLRAVCTVAGIDLADWLVRNGLAPD